MSDRNTTRRGCPRHVHAIAHERLQTVLRGGDPERFATLFRVLVWAVLRVSSLRAACRALLDAPADQTVRNWLAELLPQRRDVLEARCHRALVHDLPRSLRRGRRIVAIDWHSVPYHGEAYRSDNEFRRSKPEQGTTTFHVYATAVIVHHGERFTVALTAVTKRDTTATVLKRLLARIRELDLKIQVVLLDRQFSNGPVIAVLQREKLPFVMPAMFRGRAPKRGAKPRGMRAFRTKKPGWYRHTLTVAGLERRCSICVAWRVVTHRRKQTRNRKVYLFVCWGIRRPPEQIRELYRRRFGIETSYRQLKRARIRTSSRNPQVRLFFVALALILRNIWVWLHLMVLAERPGHAATVDLKSLRFLEFLDRLAASNPPPLTDGDTRR